jgi:hypothetical protein
MASRLGEGRVPVVAHATGHTKVFRFGSVAVRAGAEHLAVRAHLHVRLKSLSLPRSWHGSCLRVFKTGEHSAFAAIAQRRKTRADGEKSEETAGFASPRPSSLRLDVFVEVLEESRPGRDSLSFKVRPFYVGELGDLRRVVVADCRTQGRSRASANASEVRPILFVSASIPFTQNSTMGAHGSR